jgi:GNAT superfamily N-acetyltransferase
MQIIEVKDNKNLAKEFLQLPVRLYKNDKNWIRPLDNDIEDIFNPRKNKYFRHGECTRWILQDDKGATIGRVAAFIDRKTAKTYDQPTGGMGFFECIDDKEAAFILFDICKKWLEERGMEAMDGPINFGDRDRWWGLLIDGFTEPNYGMFYHFPYYRALFEAYGFKLYFNQYTYARPVMKELSEKIADKADRIARNPSYSFSHLKVKELERYAEDFRTIYNKAWVKHKGVKEMPKAQAMTIMNKMKPVLDEEIVWFAYYDNEPVGFFIMLPELNQIFKHVNGKLDLIGKIKFVWHKWRGSCKKMFGVAFGIVPEHQGKGLEGAIVMAAAKKVQKSNFRYKDFEMNWIGDFNPKMMHVAESVGGDICKTHATFRKLFDETKPFKRAEIID